MKKIIIGITGLVLCQFFISCGGMQAETKTAGTVEVLGKKIEIRAQKKEQVPVGVKFIKTIGTVGSGVGQFFRPTAVAADFDGNIYVVDSVTERVQIFSAEGKFIYEFDVSNTEKTQKPTLAGIAVDKNYRVYVCDRQNSSVSVYEITGSISENTSIKSVSYSGLLENKGAMKTLSELEVGQKFAFVSANPGGVFEVKSKYIDSMTAEKTSTMEEQDFNLSAKGNVRVYVKVEFDRPGGLATDDLGNIYVVDTYNESVKKFDYFGTFSMEFGSFGGGMNQFNNPADVCLDYDRNIYVADAGNNRIGKFDFNGNYLAVWGKAGKENGEFSNPLSVDIDRAGNVFVADTGNNRVQVFDRGGKFLFQFIPGGIEKAKNFNPVSLAVSEKGFVYVLDSFNNLLSMFEVQYE